MNGDDTRFCSRCEHQARNLHALADRLELALTAARRAAGEQGAVWHPLTLTLAGIVVDLRDTIAAAAEGDR